MLSYAIDGIKDVIDTACEILNTEEAVSAVYFSSLEIFKDSLEKSPKSEIYKQPALKSLNVFGFFLTKSRSDLAGLNRRVGEKTNRTANWNRLVVAGYRAMRRALRSSFSTQKDTDENGFGKNDNQIEDSARAIFLVMKYADCDKIFNRFPDILENKIIDDAIKRAMKVEEFKQDYADFNVKIASLLFNNKEPERGRRAFYPRSGNVACGDGNSQPVENESVFDDDAEDEQPQPIVKTPEESEWENTRREQIIEGGSRHEYPAAPKPSDIIGARGGLPGAMRPYVPLGHTAPWDYRILSLESIAVVLAALTRGRAAANLSHDELRLYCFLLAQIFFGFPAKYLVEARIGSGGSAISYDSGYFYIYPQSHDNDSVFGQPNEATDNKSRPSAHQFRLPAPPPVRAAFDLLAGKFSGNQDLIFGENELLPDLSRLNKQLNRLEFGGEFIADYLGERVSLEKVGAAVGVHQIYESDTDEMLLAFINGFVPRHLAAQAHYVNLLVKFIQLKYERVWQTIYTRIREESRFFSTESNFPALTLTANDDVYRAADAEWDARLGSPFLPKEDAAARYLHQLFSIYESEKDPLDKHNYLTAYTALCLMHATAVRPHELENITADQILFFGEGEGNGQICITAKKNFVFAEWRLLSLTEPFARLLKFYRRAAENTVDMLVRNGAYPSDITSDRDGSLLFFVGNKKYVHPISSSNIYDFLKNKTACPVPVFGWRFNAPRHFFATTALLLGIPRKLIDALTGHMTTGREPRNKNAKLLTSDELAAAEIIVKEIQEKLDIKFPYAD